MQCTGQELAAANQPHKAASVHASSPGHKLRVASDNAPELLKSVYVRWR